jgi:dihydroorotase
MSKYLIKKVRIGDPRSSFYNKVVNVVLENSVITSIGSSVKGDGKEIDGKGATLYPGWIDMRAFSHDPGMEYKEDLKSLARAALSGGYTGVCLFPNESSKIQNKQDVQYITNHSDRSQIDIFPVGACTEGLKGEEITEMYDMKVNGAIGFSNGNTSIAHAGVMNRILQYVGNIEARIFLHSQLDYLVPNWQMSEGLVNIKTGMKGLPKEAETMIVNRDIALAEYNNVPVHFSHISCEESVKLIREAKKKKLAVTADVSIMHLIFTDEYVASFDSNFKLTPPLRSEKDRLALIKGIKDGVLDAIVSDHLPQDVESKVLEYNYADFGASTIQWSGPAAANLFEENEEAFVNAISINPRNILNLDESIIDKGNKVSLTMFDGNVSWDFDKKSNKSKSNNSPFFGTEIKGKVVATYHKGKLHTF